MAVPKEKPAGSSPPPTSPAGAAGPNATPAAPSSMDKQLVARGPLCWTMDAELPFMGSNVPVRMTVLGVPPSGKQKTPKKDKKGALPPPSPVDLVVVSPLEPSPEVVRSIQALGPVKFIVAPNAMHHLFAASFKAAFPAAKLVAPADLKAKVPDLPADFIFPDLPKEWPAEHINLLSVPLIGDELVLVHKPSGTLVVTDLCFNFGESHNHRFSWFMATYLWATGGYAKCTLTKPFKWLIKDPAATQAALDKLLTLNFDQLVMAHGDVVPAGGKQALQEGTCAFVARLAEARARPPGGLGAQWAALSKSLPQSLPHVDPKYLAVGGLAAGAAAVLGYTLVAAHRRH